MRGFFLAILLTGFITNCARLDNANTSSNTATNSTNSSSQWTGNLTRAKFEALRDGMSVAEVEGIIGRPGKVIMDTKDGDKPYSTYEWTARLGHWIHVRFYDNKLVAKEHGLLE